MKRRNATRSALFTSIISLLLCVSMLVGTTFAWFTDSVVSGNNVIAAGNLDIELYHKDKDNEGYVDNETKLFNDITYWEPGVVVYENFTVENKGTLALQYKLSVNAVPVGDIDLTPALKIAVVEGGFFGDRADAHALANLVSLESFVLSGELEGNTNSKVYGVVIYWEPSNNDNYYNMNNENQGKVLSVDLGVKLFATQEIYESDSFGPDYDKKAEWTGGIETAWYFNTIAEDPNATEFTVETAEDLAGLAALVNGTATAPVSTFAATAPATVHDDFKGKTIKLGDNVDLVNYPWIPIGRIGTTSTDFTYAFKGTFDGQGYTVSNLDVEAYGWAGLFGLAHSAEIKNLKIDTAFIRANRMAGAVVGQMYGSVNGCHVTGAEIIVTPNAVGDTYDNGDKVGGIVGWLGDNGNNRTLTNCSATEVKLSAYRDVGGIAGYVASSTTVEKNSVQKVTITVDQVSNHYGDKDFNAGMIYGRTGGAISESDNSSDAESTIEITYAKDGLTFKKDGVTGEVMLYRVPASYENTTVNVPEGVKTIGGYAFAYNDNVEKIVLPSSVTSLNDRAFRDTSASEVVLNEGLTNISYQAFRNASNVKSVVIPSTVTTISKEAFQNSGITTLTIPANVTTIEYGGCRDMKELTEVIIEGNVDVPVYAFRACTNLRTVILKGDDVTFGGGSRGMIFTNKENGDGSAITVCVANETVKERLIAADTAAKDYGGYTILIGTPVANVEDLNAALANGRDVALTQNLTTSNDFTAENTNIDLGNNTLGLTSSDHKVAGDLTIKNGTVDVSNGYFDVRSAENKEVVIENVVFTNTKLSKTYGNSTDRVESALEFCPVTAGVKTTFVFRNCTFNNSNVIFEAMSGKAGEFTALFENCTFNNLGNSEAIEISNYLTGEITIKNCTFNMTATANICIVDAMSSSTITVNFEGNNTVNGTAAVPTTDPSLTGTENEIRVFSTQSVKVVSQSVDHVNGLDNVTVTGIATK